MRKIPHDYAAKPFDPPEDPQAPGARSVANYCVPGFLAQKPCADRSDRGTDGKVYWDDRGPVAWWRDRKTIYLDCEGTGGGPGSRFRILKRIKDAAPIDVNVVCMYRGAWTRGGAPASTKSRHFLDRAYLWTRRHTPEFEAFEADSLREIRELERRQRANREWASEAQQTWNIERRRLVYKGETMREVLVQAGLPTAPPYLDEARTQKGFWRILDELDRRG